MVDERVIAIVRLLGLERLHMVPSIKLDHGTPFPNNNKYQKI